MKEDLILKNSNNSGKPNRPNNPGKPGGKDYIQCNCNPRTTCGRDFGPRPLVLDLCSAARNNSNFRTTLWSGEHLQMTLMCIPEGCDIGLEVHPDTDQCLLVECGRGRVCMGKSADSMTFECTVCSGSAVFVPAGMYHNIINTACESLKIASVYAPPHHPHGTNHKTQCDDVHD
jgi:mannose-6-phosphate isomerase-like protein (cupin superfamily)